MRIHGDIHNNLKNLNYDPSQLNVSVGDFGFNTWNSALYLENAVEWLFW